MINAKYWLQGIYWESNELRYLAPPPPEQTKMNKIKQKQKTLEIVLLESVLLLLKRYQSEEFGSPST